MRAVTPVAGQETHGTTFRTPKVTFQVATPGAESAVCGLVVLNIEDYSSVLTLTAYNDSVLGRGSGVL